ncbi:MAG: hypothetical protein GWN70_08930, partial [Gemmatimonadetes bacterium]|nr:hypothetical protein [Gemmatimonadota bacterium]NIV82844.1 hypothetical protein [Gemmatimonadota bacterium]
GSPRGLLLASALATGGVLGSGLVLPHLLLWSPLALEWRRGPEAGEVTVFAHRGGVVLPGAGENTLPALRAAIARGYDGVEVDVRETADGALIAQHDAGFERTHAAACRRVGFVACPGRDYGSCADEARRLGARRCHVADMALRDVSLLSEVGGGEKIPTLAEYLEVAGRAGLEVMLDFKQTLTPGAVRRLERLLEAHLPEGPVYLIGKTDPKLAVVRRNGYGRFGVPRSVHPVAYLVGKLAARGEPFVFQNGVTTRGEDLAYASVLGVEIIPTLNWHHLGRGASDAERERLIAVAHRELERLYGLGVRKFQIDSDFDGIFFDPGPGG